MTATCNRYIIGFMDRTSAVWYVQLFGGLQATHQQSRSITRFRSHKAGVLLAYLALFPRHPHSREELAEMLWPEMESGRVNLRTVLSSLRRELEPDGTPPGSVLLTVGHTDVYLAPASIETDVAQFERLLKVASRPSLSFEEKALQLTEAVAIYTGPLLPVFYENWVVRERQRLTTLYLDALGQLSYLYEQAGEFTSAIEFAQRALDTDPLSEEAHTSLIRLHAATGDRVGALRQYQEMERLLKEEMRVAPSPEVRAMVEALKEESGSLHSSSATQDSPSASGMVGRSGEVGARPASGDELSRLKGVSAPFPVRLPPTFTTFYGREEESRTLSHSFRSGQSRLLTITGPGGSGKTRLAIETARRMTEFFPGGILFVPLADLHEARHLPEAIADALDLPRSATLPLLEQIAEALNAVSAQVLLILDNFEQIVEEGSGLVQTLVAAAPTLYCLVTSRHRLLVEAERDFILAPLPIPEHPGTPQRLLEFPSVQLFVSRARSARSDFELTEHNADAVAALCLQLEGIPLALELAAAWAQILTPAQMLARLDSRFDLLIARRRDTPTRHRTLRATIAWGVDLLSPDQRDFFIGLSIFRGGFSLEAAEQVCEEPDALTFLANLCDHSLLIAEQPDATQEVDALPQQMRFRMLETVREFAQEQQAHWSAEKRIRIHTRHTEYFLRKVEEAEPHLHGSPQQRFWLNQLQVEPGNLQAALEWTRATFKKHGLIASLCSYLRLCGALWTFWLLRGHLAEAERWLLHDDIISLADNASGIPTIILARALHARAEIAHIREEMDVFAAAMERALVLYRQAGDKSGAGQALARLARRKQGIHYEERRRMARNARRLCRAAGDQRAEADVLQDQAWLIRCKFENYRRAHQFMARATALYRAAGDTEHVISVLRERGTWHAWALETESARTLLNEALTLARHQNNLREIGYILWSLGYVADFDGDLTHATELFREGVQVARTIGDSWCLLLNLTRFGLTLLAQDEDDTAATVFRESLPLARRTSERNQIAMFPELYIPFEGFAMIATRRGDLRRAARLLGVTWAIGRPGPDEEPLDYASTIYKRYLQMRVEIRATPDGMLSEWKWGSALCPSQADQLALDTL